MDMNVMTEERPSWHLKLYRAAFEGHWAIAEETIEQYGVAAMQAMISRDRTGTLLHIAVSRENNQFVEKLLRKMCGHSNLIAQRDTVGKTALSTAAIAGNFGAAKMLVEMNPNLLYIKNKKKLIPVHYAAKYGHRRLAEYLLNVTEQKQPRDKKNPFAGKSGVTLLNFLITADFHDMALELLMKENNLALGEDYFQKTAFQTLARRPLTFASKSPRGCWKRLVHHCIPVLDEDDGPLESSRGRDMENPRRPVERSPCHPATGIFGQCIRRICNKKMMDGPSLKLLKYMCKITEDASSADVWKFLEEPLITAAELGRHEFVMKILESHPGLIWSKDKIHHRSVLHIAVLYRYEELFAKVYKMVSRKHPIIQWRDKEENNILHMAGMLSPSDRVSGAALHMQKELQWFKEMEKCVQPSYSEETNNSGMTPREVFSETHKELHAEGERWMKKAATSCSVVAALILTVMFEAAFKANEEGNSVHSNETSFLVFVITDAIGLFFSTTSVLMFLGILTSRYAEEDFLASLPKQLIWGLISLFISIAAMMVAFGAILYVLLAPRVTWISGPLIGLALAPVSLFVLLLYPLLHDILRSTRELRIVGK